MSKKLYALLVGINEYDKRSRVPWLKGCVNDVSGMQAYLEGRVSQKDFELKLKMLTDSRATRQGIIDGFRQHLALAGKDDVVLFYYAGHGAQAIAPEPFWPVSPDRMMETLVCYDSRIDDQHWDLADKELAQLISEVDSHEPHIAVLLDCCHSGSGTREGEVSEVATRRAEIDKRLRPLESFIVSADAAQALVGESVGTRSLSPMAIKLPPTGRHVVLAACQNIEEAKEYHGGGKARGAFSYFLQDSLNKANGQLSYRDLFKRTNALIRSGVMAQSPQMDATHSQDLEMPFLGGAIAPCDPYFTASRHPDHGWAIDGGAIHGLRSAVGEESTVLALFPFDSQAEQLKDFSNALGLVNITRVLPQYSQIVDREGSGVISQTAETTETFKAVVVSSPLPPLSIFIEGEAAGVEMLRQAITIAAPGNRPSLYVQATDQIEGASYRVVAKGDEYTITSVAEQRPLVTAVAGYDTVNVTKVVKDLEHIARWKTIADLASPASSQIQGAVEIKIYSGDEPSYEEATEITDAQIRLSYRHNRLQDTWTPPRFRLKLRNTSDRTLYCALFYLTERFNAVVLKPDSVVSLTRLLPEQEIWFANGAPLNGTIKDVLWQQGITESQDILKAIACTDEFDPTLMSLDELGQPASGGGMRSLPAAGSLNRLMQRVNTRDIGFAEDTTAYDDWVTSQVAFTFVRPQLSTPISQSEPTVVNSTVQIQPHSRFSANVRLTTVSQSTRDLGSAILPPILQNETVPFQFAQSRASDPGLSALELNNVSDSAAVTPENPLRIETEVPLNEGEYILPVAYDGEFYLPLGYGKTTEGKTQIVIERLPEPVSEGRRSVTGSIRIFFQKVATKKLGESLSKTIGLSFEYPLLTVAELKDAKVNYERTVETIREKVAKAQNIAIYIHGIFGDTESMLPSLESAVATLEDSKTPIGQLYDLVLAFDYENLNTTIDTNARLLKARLEAVGLGVGHQKTVHIVAHSMGGLVSRWFIEQEGGSEVVNHLIMLGTPNNGSPWPQMQAGITAAVSFAINGLSLVAAPLKILEGLLKRIETIDVSLDQMQPGSDFLAELAKAKDPKVPYTLVVGNTSLIPEDKTAGLKQRLLGRLGKVAELPFFRQPNDIAVLVESITAVPEGRSPAPIHLPVACNHLEYFTNPIGLAALTIAVVGTGLGKSNSGNGSPSPEPVVPISATPEPISPEPVASEPTRPVQTLVTEPQPPATAAVSERAPFAQERREGQGRLPLWAWGFLAIALVIAVVFGLAQRPDVPSESQTEPQIIESQP